MDQPHTRPPLPAEYYRRHAARVRLLADAATTAAFHEHLRGIAQEYERLAERAESTTLSETS